MADSCVRGLNVMMLLEVPVKLAYDLLIRRSRCYRLGTP